MTHWSISCAWYGGVLFVGKENAMKRTPPHQATDFITCPAFVPAVHYRHSRCMSGTRIGLPPRAGTKRVCSLGRGSSLQGVFFADEKNSPVTSAQDTTVGATAPNIRTANQSAPHAEPQQKKEDVMIDTSAYMLRISQASPVGLVVINFELVLEFLNEAVENASNKEIYQAAIVKAKDGLEQLIQSLDFGVPISQDFYDIYNYAYKLLSDVQFAQDIEAACVAVKEVVELMETLLVGWRDAEEKFGTEAVPAEETPKVYTGLTYGRDGNANEYIDENKDRGYMA